PRRPAQRHYSLGDQAHQELERRVADEAAGGPEGGKGRDLRARQQRSAQGRGNVRYRRWCLDSAPALRAARRCGPAQYHAANRLSAASVRWAAVEDGDGLSIPYRPEVSPARRSNRGG